MKIITAVLITLLTCPAPALAQRPAAPLLEQARAEVARVAAEEPLVVIKKEMEHPLLFWTGAALLAVGVTSLVASATWAQQSDLSAEYTNVRLGRDLAPCGTDPDKTTLPVADCQLNSALAWIGGSLTVVGGGMMVFGGQQIEVVQRRSLVLASIKF
jgi:hypothetical protein